MTHRNEGSPPFADLVRLELGLTPDESAKGETWLETPPRQLFGLALSGGGIRSATFNLGLLQGLHEYGMLRGFDYLATVSGGGYAGGFWSRWRAEFPDKTFPEAEYEEKPASESDEAPWRFDGNPEAREIRHLRRFSRFLSPSLGAFSFDTGRMLMALINAVVPSLIGSAAFLVLASLISMSIGWLVLVAPGVLGGMVWRFHTGAALAMLLFGSLHLFVMGSVWPEANGDRGGRRVSGAVLLAGLSILWGVSIGFDPELPSRAISLVRDIPACRTNCGAKWLEPTLWAYAVLPALILLLVPVLIAPFRALVPRHLDQFNSWLLLAAGAWSVLTSLWWIAFFIAANVGNLGAAVAGLTIGGVPAGAVISRLARLVKPGDSSSESKSQRAGRWALIVASYLVVAALVVGAMLVVILVHRGGNWLLLLGLLAGASLLVWFLGDTNRIGLHHFYRGRISRGFLGAARARKTTGADRTEEQPDDDLQLTNLPAYRTARNGKHNVRTGPLHLVVCAANNLTPTDTLASLSRGADSAVLSRVAFAVGNQWALWPGAKSPWKPEPEPEDGLKEGSNSAPTLPPEGAHDAVSTLSATFTASGAAINTQNARGPKESPNSEQTTSQEGAHDTVPTLSAALTASGAAFNTQMGAQSRALGPAVGFIMATLGLRLGLWVRHPQRFKQTGPIVRRKARLAMVRELLGLSDLQGDPWVFLSDGGHFDNTGVYELVRRHCRYVLVSDCGADSVRAFDDLGSVVRRVREDFGVDIKIDLDALRPDQNGRSRQPMVAGDIHYPDGDTGVLLVIKPTITGAEPPDILQYQVRNRMFPHQSTGDQFFDEAQWESYRRLGLHAVRGAFVSSTSSGRSATTQTPMARLTPVELEKRMRDTFGRARREWLARPADYSQRVDRLARVMGALDATLKTAGKTLQHQVYWELGEPEESDANADDMQAGITALRQALVTFESIFLSESLATEYNQPMYTGVINVMARWMRCPMMAGWWPLLQSTCSDPFRKFVETHFLEQPFHTADSAAPATALESAGSAAAATALERAPESSPRVTHKVVRDSNGAPSVDYRLTDSLGDVLPLASRSRPERACKPELTRHLVQTIIGSTGKAIDFEAARLEASHKKEFPDVAIWDARDFFVPPGLWGMGIGTHMLTTLGSTAFGDLGLGGLRQFVFVRSFWAGTPEAKKDSADLQQLYFDTGFRLARPADLIDTGFRACYSCFCHRWHKDAAYLPPKGPGDEREAREFLDADDYVVLVRNVAATPDTGVPSAHTVPVFAALHWNHTRIQVTKGTRYLVSAKGRWIDLQIEAGPHGYATSDAPWYSRWILRFAERMRRVPKANWFALILAVDEDESTACNVFENDSKCLIDKPWTAPRDGELCAYANDHPRAYGNNSGGIWLTVTQSTAEPEGRADARRASTGQPPAA